MNYLNERSISSEIVMLCASVGKLVSKKVDEGQISEFRVLLAS